MYSVSLWCSGKGIACTCRFTGFNSRRHCFLFLCTVCFFFQSLFFNTIFPFGLFSFILTAHLADHALGSICTLSLSLEFYFGKGISRALWSTIILAKLSTRKKHKLSRHVPRLKQRIFFSVLVDIMTNNTRYATNCISSHPTPTSDPLA